ncbi:sulfotransferase [Iamia sp.]|uniref:sulfotransferase n=1 Tax=Iamia sp. TaxID=2722710 RepID=UPI002BDB010B|nr:sulfotransferase [Iamia sp.]HXH58065.1 sulfotransferase [Iamia sp.]
MSAARPKPPTPDRPVVLYLGGSGRSGSTLLERLLGAVPGVTTLGEVVHLPTRGLVEGEPCACGARLASCAFWGEVGRMAFGGWDQVDGPGWQALQHRVDRNRHLPLLAVPVRAGFRRDLADHVARLERLYLAAARVSGAAVLVDSSKHASTAFALRHLRAVDVCVTHIVRDSRGVAYSWTKEVARPEQQDGLMPRYSPASSAAWWDAFNVMLAALSATGTAVHRLRYEDLLVDPAATLRAVLAPTGLHLAPGWDAFLTPDGARLGASHSVAGNPMRFGTGTVPLRRDDAWREALPAADRRVVTALTAPLLFAYGYTRRPQ